LQSARLRTAVVQRGPSVGAARHPARSAFGRMAPARRRWCTGPAGSHRPLRPHAPGKASSASEFAICRRDLQTQPVVIVN